VKGLTCYGPRGVKHRCGVFSVRIDTLGPEELANILEERYGILTRPGIHCAPLGAPDAGTTQFGARRASASARF